MSGGTNESTMKRPVVYRDKALSHTSSLAGVLVPGFSENQKHHVGHVLEIAETCSEMSSWQVGDARPPSLHRPRGVCTTAACELYQQSAENSVRPASRLE